MRDQKLTIKKPTKRDDKTKALTAVRRADLNEEVKRLPVEIPASYHRRLHNMRANSSDSIPVKQFVLEALEDLFDKYDSGKGKYHLEK